jgi:Tfp pilus assembly protein PilN
MRALGALALAACCLLILVVPVVAQTPVDPQAAQIGSLRKEMQRQRRVQATLKKELDIARATIGDLNRKITDQEVKLVTLHHEVSQIWAGGAVGFAVLLSVLLIIAFRRPRAPSPPDELQQRLAALDHKLRELSPRNGGHR